MLFLLLLDMSVCSLLFCWIIFIIRLFSLQPLHIQCLPTVWITNKTNIPAIAVASSGITLLWQWRADEHPPSSWWWWEIVWFGPLLRSTSTILTLRRQLECLQGRRPLFQHDTRPATWAQLEARTLSNCRSGWTPPASAPPAQVSQEREELIPTTLVELALHLSCMRPFCSLNSLIELLILTTRNTFCSHLKSSVQRTVISNQSCRRVELVCAASEQEAHYYC